MTRAERFVSGSGKVVVQRYEYDALGRRSSATRDENHEKRYFVYDGQDVLIDLTPQGNLESRYLRGDGMDQTWTRLSANSGKYWYVSDRLGSVRWLLDDQGAVREKREYDPYGNYTEGPKLVGDRYGYTGREYDSFTKLQFNRGAVVRPGCGALGQP
jgi:hypothetical protein